MTINVEVTQEQLDMVMDMIKNEYTQIALNTDKCDRKKCQELLTELYKSKGFSPPKHFIWVQNPIIGFDYAVTLHLFGSQFDQMIKDGATKTQITAKIKELLKESKKPAHADARYKSSNAVADAQSFGNLEASWAVFYDWFNRIGVKEVESYKPLLLHLRKQDFWWTFEEVCIISEKLEQLNVDETGRLHSDTGPALGLRKGKKLYFVHNVSIPDAYMIEEPSKITIKRIREETNQELKRILRERYGEARYLTDIKAKVIDVDTVLVDNNDKTSEEIIRSLMEDDEKQRHLVTHDGSTQRGYTLLVPASCNTCKEAHSFLAGMNEERFISQS